MIKKIYSAVVLLTLVAPVAALATEEAAEVHGLVDLGVRGEHNNANDSSKFKEFRGMNDGVFGQIQLDAIKSDYNFQFDAEKSSDDDQSFQLKGGQYGNFKYKFNYDQFTHNYGFGAATPAAGLGSSYILFPAMATVAATPVSQWNHFDYSVDHKTYGGELEVSLRSPFYVRAGVERQEQSGFRPYSFARPAEFPQLISNRTDTMSLKAGYLSEAITASLTGSLSSFNNDFLSMHYETTGTAIVPGTQVDRTAVFAPDNENNRLGADLTWRDLPLASVLAVGGSYTHQTSNYAASDVGVTAATWSAATGFSTLNRTTFDGVIDTTSASISLASNPLDKLDSKIYYRYLNKDNSSSVISYNSGATSNGGELSSYKKNDVGLDLSYRLPEKTKLEGGLERLTMDRSVPEEPFGIPANKTKDTTEYIGLKNSSLDWLTAKIRYKHMKRNTDELETPIFSYLDQAVNEWKLGFDFYPADTFDIGLSFAYKKINYDENIQTIQNDKRTNTYLDATWRASKMLTLAGFVGYETTKNDAHRIANSTTTNNAYSTTTPYVMSNDDNFWTYGLSANVAATEKLTFNLAWQYQKSDGQVDFSNPNFPSTNAVDDYTKNTLEAKAIYAIDPRLKMTLGYMYEKYKYEDANYANYLYQPVATQTYYYSGLNADPNYQANIGYLMVSYGF